MTATDWLLVLALCIAVSVIVSRLTVRWAMNGLTKALREPRT